MKRIALILLTLIVGFAFVRADNPCTRYFAGNRGYVKVYYNRSDNKLEISSQTGMNIRHIAELQIKVTCTHKWQIRGIRERGTNRVISPAKWNEELVTICDSRYTNIPVNKSISLSNGLADLPQDSNTDYFENFNVTISNPLLSSENEISTSENRVQENRTPSKSNDNNATEKTPEDRNGNATENKTNNANNPQPSNVCQPTFPSAGGNTCPVENSSNNNRAFIESSTVVSNSYSSASISVRLAVSAAEKTLVEVALYDGGTEVGRSTAVFLKGESYDNISFSAPEAKHRYTAKIVSAYAVQ